MKKKIFWVLFYTLVAVLICSPKLIQNIEISTKITDLVEATASSCELRRDGKNGANTIACDLKYEFNGAHFISNAEVWSSHSPLLALEDLHLELNLQSAALSHLVYVDSRTTGPTNVVEQRWLAVPPLWASFALLIVVLLGAAMMINVNFRRTDLTYDAASGDFIDINNKRKIKIRCRKALLYCVIFLGFISVAYVLSDRMRNSITLLGFSQLQATPAKLVNCHPHGGYKGSDSIECEVQYQFRSKTYLSQAESISFPRSISDAGIYEKAEMLNQAKEIIAYVDPLQPAFAIAFINNDWFSLNAFGFLELATVIIWMGVLIGSLVIMVKS